ncbi:hypothetical protein J507_0874 [Acinetobacter sp. 1295259]|nr:hypothetical protein J507_0874 [Acinetobacter sp. 1295259]
MTLILTAIQIQPRQMHQRLTQSMARIRLQVRQNQVQQ